ncbi:MAG: hypothetical protein E7082_08840 [Bacteroidales bacterium]|nr:hypothetical protein [Bacteroidales bacterium]
MHTACFRRFIRRTLSLRERACIESLERQRQRSGRVRALINDPLGALTRVLLEYLSWHQARLTERSAVIISPQKISTRLRAKTLTHRRVPSLRGYCRPVGQIIIFQADRLKRLGQAVATVAPLLSGRDTILLIVGDTNKLTHHFSPSFYQIHDYSTKYSPPKPRPRPKPISHIRNIRNISHIKNITLIILRPKNPAAEPHPKPALAAFLF